MSGPRWIRHTLRDDLRIAIVEFLMLIGLAAMLGVALALIADPVGLVRWLASWGLPTGLGR